MKIALKHNGGNIATDIDKTVSDANENYVDAQFNKMRVNFHDQGIGGYFRRIRCYFSK